MQHLALLFVLGSGLAHALWNVLAKKSEDKAVFLFAMYIPSTILLLPFVWQEMWNSRFSFEEWLLIVVSMILQAAYAWLLAYTYKRCDLSQAYPVMRGTSTLLIPVFGVVLLHESLPALGWVGVVCLLVGFIVMSGWNPLAKGSKEAGFARRLQGGDRQQDWKPFLLAVIIGICTTAYTIVDKLNLEAVSPLALLVITNIGFMLGLTPAAVVSGNVQRIVFQQWKPFLVGAILSPGSYLLFLLAMQHADVAYIAPLREIGIVFGVVLGILMLKEKRGTSRLIGSLIIVAGIFLIAVSGS